MMKKVAIILFCLMASMNGMAQTKKAITLNDVIPGGTNFRNLGHYLDTAWTLIR
jgi:dipeptidyl-peptidase-4